MKTLPLGLMAFGLILTSVTYAKNQQQPAGAYWHESSITTSPAWMKNLPDTTTLSELSLPATHDTMATSGGDIVQTQSLSPTAQFQAGVRGFDLRCLQRNDKCLFAHGPVIQGTELENDFLKPAQLYLHQNPSETLVVRIKSETTDITPPQDNTLSFDQMVERYIEKRPTLFWNPQDSASATNPPLSETRGKIVILRDYSLTNSAEQGIDYESLAIQDAYQIDTPITDGIYAVPGGIYKKWEAIKQQFQLSARQSPQTLYANFLSGSSGSLLKIPPTTPIDLSTLLPAIPNIIPPYFVASGHAIHATTAPRLGTGILNQPSLYPDFPHLPALLGVGDEIFYEGTNILAMVYLNSSPLPQRTGIVFADFIGPELIQSIIRQNDAIGTTTAHVAAPVQITYQAVDGKILPAYVDTTSVPPTRMVLICHGHHEGFDATLPLMANIRANSPADVLIAAPTYRNDQAFPVLLGAQDVIALTQKLTTDHTALNEVIFWGNSMGGGICGTAAAELGKNNTLPSDVTLKTVFLSETVTQLKETYDEAKLVSNTLVLLSPSTAETLKTVVTEIDQDIDSLPGSTREQAFERRSPVNQAAAIKNAGVQNMVITQGVFDITVPDNQSIEMKLAAANQGIQYELIQAGLGTPGADGGDSLLSLLMTIPGLKNINQILNLTGHGYTGAVTHPVICQTLMRLNDYLNGKYTPDNKITVVSYPGNTCRYSN
ncbi:hypothetical protein OQ483_02470 [Enterobacter bugandensis]|uniref:phosphatidylinositol-specific phospholipase C domain-containing protein n=1 Tax=Enterobacter bugandensis TaxID=881260 RepID=UPI00283AAE5B|nr:phosphatidylinositol-specific phospholipase C domain-containing protein [Enterobacter bugandensis]WMU73322.1 hypothetical protein OQ483_02470 [Enterobacter bugandensis]